MYAGTLSRVHNVHTLVAVFRECCADVDFWIFGDGELKEMVVEATKEDSRIHYVGKVSRDDLLHAQKKAHVLISAKASNDEHTKFAFPSKILEYMSSGMAVLSTRVGGIPQEYFKYIYPIEDESIRGIAASIEYVFTKSDEELEKTGKKQENLPGQKKNCCRQAQKMIVFLSKI